jgi:hypothetical protein
MVPLCEKVGKHDTPARTGGNRGLQASEKISRNAEAFRPGTNYYSLAFALLLCSLRTRPHQTIPSLEPAQGRWMLPAAQE